MGKVLQPQNALPARPPAGASASGAEPATAEALGWQLRAALPPMRLHSVSIYDSQGNVLWLSEGALGPDEHSLVLDALEMHAADAGKTYCENGLEDGRLAAFLAIRAPQGHLVGLVMILTDFKSGGDGLMDRIMSAPTRTIMQKLAVLLRPAGPRRPDADPTALVLSLAEADVPIAPPEPKGAAVPSPARAAAASPGKADTELTARAVNDILEFELTDTPVATRAPAMRAPVPAQPAAQPAAHPAAPPPPAVNGHSHAPAHPASIAHSGSVPTLKPAPLADTGTSRVPRHQAPADTGASRTSMPPAAADTGSARTLKPPAPAETGHSRSLAGPAQTGTSGTSRALSLDPALVTLEMLPFVKLRSGGRTRRFELVPSGSSRELRDPAVLDCLAVQRLLAWLGGHRAAWTVEPASFTLNLSIATLEDEGFLKQVAAGLQSHGVPPDTVGFEIAEPLCTQRRAQVERFMAACDKLGCFVIIDDFSFDSAVVPLLRSKALRLVKIDARLTAAALRDKLSQAMVVAVVQAVKVLGIHCAAQQVDSQAALQWLTAVGCDFAQGPMLARQQPLDGLLGPAS
ncbi:MAG TPA: EAL domain-containing protein [Steroidobacteraceae bacterium]|nr:EAL domain-containing protein [Steroidobacteraceae bacterium]